MAEELQMSGLAQQVPVVSEGATEQQMSILVDRLITELQKHGTPSPNKPLKVQPAAHEPRVLKWLSGLMPTFIAVFGFGGQITFTVIPTIVKDEDVPSDMWGPAQVRTFLSLAWMFFTLGLGLSAAMALLPVYGGEDFRANIESGRYDKLVNSLCAVLQLFAALAFLFISLVVVAYTPVVGWIVLGISCLAVMGTVFTFIVDTWL
jgi:hypothetical protein